MKVAPVTGGSSGMGEATATELARRVTDEIIYVDGGMHIASPR